jgi:hypothetical protein
MRNPAGCGTDGGYQRHKAIREVPCPRCYAAHSATNANARAWLRSQEAPDEPLRYTAAHAGREPAEALTTHDRARLVAELVIRGWTDQRIAEHTRQTLYTTCRIRERIGLSANQPAERSAA